MGALHFDWSPHDWLAVRSVLARVLALPDWHQLALPPLHGLLLPEGLLLPVITDNLSLLIIV